MLVLCTCGRVFKNSRKARCSLRGVRLKLRCFGERSICCTWFSDMQRVNFVVRTVVVVTVVTNLGSMAIVIGDG